jgi:hypothetical protein
MEDNFCYSVKVEESLQALFLGFEAALVCVKAFLGYSEVIVCPRCQSKWRCMIGHLSLMEGMTLLPG